jgi:hypothetical protein
MDIERELRVREWRVSGLRRMAHVEHEQGKISEIAEGTCLVTTEQASCCTGYGALYLL